MKTSFFSEAHYREVLDYEESTRFDFHALHDKYADPFSGYPKGGITAVTDVIIAGGGPSGLMYGLYLAQRGFNIIVIEPRTIGSTSREWNISLQEFMQLRCILSEEELHSCICGAILSDGYFSFRNYYTFKSNNVLDRLIDPEYFLLLLQKKIIACRNKPVEEIFYQTGYENFKLKNDRICVLTTDGRTIEGRLFLHGMGTQDEISYFSNYTHKKTCYNVVGIRGTIGLTSLPCGDVLRTLEDASFGRDNQQIGWELFMSERPVSDCATIYCFYMSENRGSLVELLKYLEEHCTDYIHTEVKSVKKVLFGYINHPHDVTGLERSAFPRVYAIGEGNINSVVTGCGFGLCIKSLAHIGSQLMTTLTKDNGTPTAMSAKKLNTILPDARQLCSISIEQLIKETLIRGRNETVEKPNLHCAALFRLLSLISDPNSRNDMLKSIIRPHLFLEALLKVSHETEYSLADFIEIITSNNGDLHQRLKLIASNYYRLIRCEIGELCKHLFLFLTLRRGNFTKGLRHLRTIWRANPVQFYLVHHSLKKRAEQMPSSAKSPLQRD